VKGFKKMRFDVITFGSATIDLFIESNEFKLVRNKESVAICEVYGAKIEVDRFALSSGGGGTNTAVGLARLGLKTAVVARLGSDIFAEIVLAELRREKVNTSFLVQKPDDKTDFSVILVTSEGGRTILVYRGQTRLEEEDVDFKKLSADWFHISSLEGNVALAKKLAEQARDQGAKVSWNPGSRELAQSEKIGQLFSLIDILVLNQEEMESFLQDRMENGGFWKKVFSLPIKTVAITQGKKGAWLAFPFQKKKFHRSPFETKVAEETGAGDAFCAGLIAAFYQGKPAAEAVDWGLLNGAAAVSDFGAKAGLLTRAVLEARLGRRV
jgi:ribokinase